MFSTLLIYSHRFTYIFIAMPFVFVLCHLSYLCLNWNSTVLFSNRDVQFPMADEFLLIMANYRCNRCFAEWHHVLMGFRYQQHCPRCRKSVEPINWVFFLFLFHFHSNHFEWFYKTHIFSHLKHIFRYKFNAPEWRIISTEYGKSSFFFIALSMFTLIHSKTICL